MNYYELWTTIQKVRLLWADNYSHLSESRGSSFQTPSHSQVARWPVAVLNQPSLPDQHPRWTNPASKINTPGEPLTIRQRFSCTTSNLVYIITCRACTLSYVGETGRRLGDRFCEHLRSVSKKADLPVAKHFSSPGRTTDDMMVAVVRAGLHNTRDRRRAEGRLICKCKTLQPRGINIDFNFIWANSFSARFKCCHIWIKWRAFSVTASSTDEGTVVPKRLDFQTF